MWLIDRVGLDVVPGHSHGLLERPRGAARPLQVAAAQVGAEGLRAGPARAGARRRRDPSAGSAGPRPPTSITPGQAAAATSRLPGIRSPWVITSPPSRGSSRNAAHRRRSGGTSSSPSLRSKHVSIQASWSGRCPPRLSPENVRPRVSMARTPAMNSARSWANASELPVGRRHGAGQPGLHRPRQRVAGPGLADRDRLRGGEAGPAVQLAGRRGLRLEPPRASLRRDERQPRDEVVAEPEEGVDRPLRADGPQRQLAPLRELPRHEPADGLRGDVQLPRVHAHGAMRASRSRTIRAVAPQIRWSPTW